MIRPIFVLLVAVGFCSDRLITKGYLVNEPSNFFQKSDTVFILREIKNNSYHAIYIDKNRDSKSYERLMDFKFSKNEQASWAANHDSVKRINSFKKVKTYDLPQNWLPLI